MTSQLCSYPNCHYLAEGWCESGDETSGYYDDIWFDYSNVSGWCSEWKSCDAGFCSDHGSRGGDRDGGSNPNGSPYGAYAVPSVCWQHGGFNVDE